MAAAGGGAAAGEYDVHRVPRASLARETFAKTLIAWRKSIKPAIFAEAYPTIHKSNPDLVPKMFDELWDQLTESMKDEFEALVESNNVDERFAALEKMMAEIEYERKTFKRPLPLDADPEASLRRAEIEAMEAYKAHLEATLGELVTRNDELEARVASLAARAAGVRDKLERRLSVLGTASAATEAFLSRADGDDSAASASAAVAGAGGAGFPLLNEPVS